MLDRAPFEDRNMMIADGHHRYQTALDHHGATGRDEDGSLLVCMVRDTDRARRHAAGSRRVLAARSGLA